MIFGCNLSSVNPLECVSINNQECKVRPEVVNVNSNEPVCFPFSIRTSKCSGSCNNINDIRKNIFASLFSVHNTTSLSRHEQVCLMRLRFERYFSHHRAT